MTWVDLVVLAVLAVSALLAFMRGLVREVLGLGAWVGAIFAGVWALPRIRPQFRTWLGHSPVGRSGRLRRRVPDHPDRAGADLALDQRAWCAPRRSAASTGRWVWYSASPGVRRWSSLPISLQGWWFRWIAGPNRYCRPNRYWPVYRGARWVARQLPPEIIRPRLYRPARRPRHDGGRPVAARRRKAAPSGSRTYAESRRVSAWRLTCAAGRQVPRGVRRVRRLERARCRGGHRARPARAAAPRPGSRPASSPSTAAHFHSHRGLGLVGDNFGDARVIASLPGATADRPQPLCHHRRHDPAQRAAAVCRFRVRRLRGGA